MSAELAPGVVMTMTMRERERRMHPLVFWREVATQLIIREIERRGINRADDALDQALATLESGAPASAHETVADVAGENMVEEFERRAVRSGLLWCCGATDGRPCIIDPENDTGICSRCEERIR